MDIEYYTITTLPAELREWTFDLLKSNTKNLYIHIFLIQITKVSFMMSYMNNFLKV